MSTTWRPLGAASPSAPLTQSTEPPSPGARPQCYAGALSFDRRKNVLDILQKGWHHDSQGFTTVAGWMWAITELARVSQHTHGSSLPQGQRPGERISHHVNEAAFETSATICYKMWHLLFCKISSFSAAASLRGHAWRRELESSVLWHHTTHRRGAHNPKAPPQTKIPPEWSSMKKIVPLEALHQWYLFKCNWVNLMHIIHCTKCSLLLPFALAVVWERSWQYLMTPPVHKVSRRQY